MATFTDLGAGLRMALTLLAAMMLLSQVRSAPGVPHSRAFNANRAGWTLIALAALVNSPGRALVLMGVDWVSQLARRLAEDAAAAVREPDMTLPLYMRRLGAVWAVRDGRPIIDVQHG